LIECITFFGFIGGFMLRQHLRSGDSLGQYPIERRVFIVGKMSMGISWGTITVQAARGKINAAPLPVARQYIVVLLILIGIAFTIPAFLNLGSRNSFGLSDESEGLQTTGIYRISRNPMYLGFYLVTLASLVAVPHWINIGCGLLGMYIHHRIALVEEQVLLEQYTDAYEDYKRRVRRYI